jgi:hypothetical protein
MGNLLLQAEPATANVLTVKMYRRHARSFGKGHTILVSGGRWGGVQVARRPRLGQREKM